MGIDASITLRTKNVRTVKIRAKTVENAGKWQIFRQLSGITYDIKTRPSQSFSIFSSILLFLKARDGHETFKNQILTLSD